MKKLFISAYLSLFSAFAMAEDNEAFSKVENKAQEFLDFLTGPIVTTALAIAIVIAGILLARGRGNPALNWGIIFGAILIGSASQLASWLLA